MNRAIAITLLTLLMQFPVMAQLEGSKEILSIRITNAPGSVEVLSGTSKIGMKAFGGHAESEYFTGNVLPGGFDTGKTIDGTGTLSAPFTAALNLQYAGAIAIPPDSRG